jgi:GNAT superfamily N-acetyltransferase
MPHEWHRGEYTISTDPARLDLDVVHAFLTRSYWSEGISRDIVERAVARSLNFGLYRGDVQVAFARVVTDYATFAYLADVFVVEEERGRKLGVWLVETLHAHPELQGLRLWLLGTRDAHSLYEKVGFTPLLQPERWMHIRDADVYTRQSVATNEAGER